VNGSSNGRDDKESDGSISEASTLSTKPRKQAFAESGTAFFHNVQHTDISSGAKSIPKQESVGGIDNSFAAVRGLLESGEVRESLSDGARARAVHRIESGYFTDETTAIQAIVDKVHSAHRARLDRAAGLATSGQDLSPAEGAQLQFSLWTSQKNQAAS
jgi:hypothetical protein